MAQDYEPGEIVPQSGVYRIVAETRGARQQVEPGPPMTLVNVAAAQVQIDRRNAANKWGTISARWLPRRNGPWGRVRKETQA